MATILLPVLLLDTPNASGTARSRASAQLAPAPVGMVKPTKIWRAWTSQAIEADKERGNSSTRPREAWSMPDDLARRIGRGTPTPWTVCLWR